MSRDARLCAAAFACAASVSFALTPLVRRLALRLGVLDLPGSQVKTHSAPTPVFGGIAVFAGFAASLLFLRLTTSYPTGTLHNLRALLLGGTLVFLLGLADDLLRPHGLDYKPKLVVQFLAAAVLILYGLRVRFVHPAWMAAALTAVWVVGVTNAFNIIDVMDGLSSSQAVAAALGFLVVSLPSEELYVNAASAALAGAAAGFIPWNLSARRKIFLGDCGSLFLGFALAAISLGTRYSEVNDAGVFAPLLILLVPLFDTAFVSVLRLNKGRSPFLGSKDHFALRLERMGFSRGGAVAAAAAVAAAFSFAAFLATQYDLRGAAAVYLLAGGVVFWAARRLSLVDMG